jgi:hypothetical protein
MIIFPWPELAANGYTIRLFRLDFVFLSQLRHWKKKEAKRSRRRTRTGIAPVLQIVLIS